MMEPLLEYDRVEISYNGKPAVKDISVTLSEGEILGIVGESGSGKSTLIKAAIGLLGPAGMVTRGDIWYQGKNLPDLKVVGAHPGERALVLERAELMKKYENLHWDISGTGLFRWGMLRYLVEQCGNDKLLFGTDYPICNIAMQVYGVLTEKISEEAKAAIFSGNFDRLTGRI